jgi:phosphotransferase system HPr (HPr) family protein
MGLHARPAMAFVDMATGFTSKVTVFREGDDPIEADGKSVMQMLMLEAVKGVKLKIEADGDDAEAAVKGLSELFESKFGEE